MRIGKNKDDAELTPDQELEKRVDAMMDPRFDEQPADTVIQPEAKAEAEQPAEQSEAAPIDIFSGAKTAPELPGVAAVEEDSNEAAEPDTAEETTPVTDTSVIDGNPIEDANTDAAIDSIMKQEADTVLEAQDAAHKPAEPVPALSFKQKVGKFFRAWHDNVWLRRGTIFVAVILVAGLAVWPSSRYALLNAAGVRSSASMTVTDSSTGLPLRNVAVQLGGSSVKTDDTGLAKFSGLRLGEQQLHIERVAFAPIERDIVIGWGSNPLGKLGLKATGAQYTFVATDYLSGKPVKAEAVGGEASAFADSKGKIVLTVEDPQTATIEVTLKASEYRTDVLTLPVTTKKSQAVRMVAAQPSVYVTKQSGRYDVYRVDVDGKNRKLLLSGTGRERQNISVAVSPNGETAAVVSSRGVQRDSSGYLLDTLTLIDVKSGKHRGIDEAQNIRLLDWVGKKLLYTATYAGPSTAMKDRQRIVAYNVEESARSVVAMSDYFNGVASYGGLVYYAVASGDSKQPAGFFQINLDGKDRKTILKKQIWTIQRTGLTTFNLETQDGWYGYKTGGSQAEKTDPPSEAYVSRQYFKLPESSKSLWVDSRDGKGVLLVHDEKDDSDDSLVSASGLVLPVRWLSSNTVQYRVNNSGEIADYVISLDGGEPKKLVDVTATSGLSINY